MPYIGGMEEEAPWYERVVIPALLRHARNTYGKAMRAALEEAGYDDIPGNGLYIIGGLALDGDIPLRQLVKDLGITKQGAGQLVDALVMRGYLSRTVDENDRRQLIVTLTDRGRGAADVQAQARERIDAELLNRVGATDLFAARRVLGTLIAMHREEADAAA
jgi:DNA-binding MarR family transcriptional regulator